jgi:AcrR family transcriptional regulator
MPKSTFDHLPEAKKQAIVAAARSEFSAVPFTEASINRIIKAAGISRGSFYQYFEDKYDLVCHLLSRFYQRFHALAKDRLRLNGGDWLDTLETLRVFLFESSRHPDNQAFFANMLAHFRVHADEELARLGNRDWIRHAHAELIPFIDATRYRVDPELLLDTGLLLLKHQMYQTILDHQDADTSKRQFLARLDLLADGAMERKDNSHA